MLAWLISAHQVILLCTTSETYLFFDGKVHFRQTSSGFGGLPTHQKASYFPIWALVDVDFKDRGPPFMSSTNVWPMQVSSPNPIRWKDWRKQFEGALLGMPVWSVEELLAGYVFYFPFLPWVSC